MACGRNETKMQYLQHVMQSLPLLARWSGWVVGVVVGVMVEVVIAAVVTV